MWIRDGNGFLFVSHIGDVYPSGFLQRTSVFKELRNPDLFKGKCGVCGYRKLCGGSRAQAYAMTGDYFESEPTCTYIPNGYSEEAVL